jgi:lipopolysaccharide export system protein LptA
MKKIILLLCLGLGFVAVREAFAKQKEPIGDTDIKADRFEYTAEFDKNGGRLVYTGQVLVENLRAKVLCDRLVIFVPKNGEQPNRIEAQTNVVIVVVNQGETTRATCSLAVYTRSVSATTTNTIVTLTGNPFIEDTRGSVTGDVIVWNLATGGISGSNTRTHINPKSFESSGTNPSAIKFF